MFARKNKYARLEITSGNQVGKTYHLKKGEYSIGTHKKCNIKIVGDYASELHAVIKHNADGCWTLTNNSPNGPYVNKQSVDSVELDQVSTIQVGAENSMEFTPKHHKNGSVKHADTDNDESQKKKTNKWVWIGSAIAMVYLPAFVYLQNYLGEIVERVEKPAITLTAIEKVSDESFKYLVGDKSEDVDMAKRKSLQSDFEYQGSRDLYEKVVMDDFRSEDEKQRIISMIIFQSKTHLTSAYHYVQMDLNEKAQQSLRSAISVYPDHRFPASKFAAKTISAIQPEEVD